MAMSNVKKMLGVLMAAMLCFALTPIAAFADEAAGGSIEINNAIKDETYSVYKILDLESYNEPARAYSYTVDKAWKSFFEAAEQKNLGIEVNKQSYVSWEGANSLPASDIAAFAQRALAYAKANKISPTKTETATSEVVSFTGLALGYYLLDSSMGTICSLDTTNPEVTVKEKNDKPTIEKQVQENPTGGWGDRNDASIGDTVNFRSFITCQPGTVDYVFTDTMSEGLTLEPRSIVVAGPAGKDLNPQITPDVAAGTIVITFDDDEIAAIAGSRDEANRDNVITITYSATLNNMAVVAGNGNDNTVELAYKSDPNDTSRKDNDDTKTFTWGMPVFKYTGDDPENGTPLAGAEFTLTDANDKVKASVTTNETGRFEVKGLDEGTYTLTEDKAPDGYNKLAGPLSIYINHEGQIFIDGDKNAVNVVNVQNLTGLELPSTGGIGTTIFYIVGGILVVGAIAFLIVRRRANSTK